MEATKSETEVVETGFKITPAYEEMSENAIDYENSGKLIAIANQVEYNLQVNIIRQIKEKYAEVETERKKLVKPVNDAKTAIQAFFKPILDRLDHAEDIRRQGLNKYDREVKVKAAEEEQRIADELKKKKDYIETAAVEAREDGNEAQAVSLEVQSNALPTTGIKIEREKVKGVSRTTTYSYEVVDIEKVPRMWLMIDDKALKAFATSSKGGKKVDGIKFISDTQVNIGKG